MSSVPATSRERAFGAIRWTLLVLAVADLAALKAGLAAHSHLILAALMAATMLAFGARAVQLFVLRSAPVQRFARLAIALGVVIAVGGGLTNWALGLQGYVILTEGEKARLGDGAELQGFEPGPLARIDELDVLLGLDELDLVPSGPDRFFPASHLRVWRGHDSPVSLIVDPRNSRGAGSLRFHQGAFGFAPRIVVLQEGEAQETVFDKVVPFLTERRGPEGILFNGSFTIAEADLRVEGGISLDSLDEGMRGHATLDLTVTLGEKLLGRGRLLPGHFADLENDYRVGFAGLKRWSEIVISRRSYGAFVLTGTVLAVVGALLLPVARWRGW